MRRMRTGFTVAAGAAVLLGVVAAYLSIERVPGGQNQAQVASLDPRADPGSTPRTSTTPAGLPPVKLAPSSVQGPVPGLSVDPKAPDYDARKLIKLTGDPMSVYEAEPRNPRWAPAVEAQMGPLLKDTMRDLLPEVQDVKMECRSTICAVNWSLDEASKGADYRARFAIVQLFPGLHALSRDGGYLIRWDDKIWTGDIRDTDAFIEQARKRAAQRAEALRSVNLSQMGTGKPSQSRAQ
jgi:hypothetical protein